MTSPACWACSSRVGIGLDQYGFVTVEAVDVAGVVTALRAAASQQIKLAVSLVATGTCPLTHDRHDLAAVRALEILHGVPDHHIRYFSGQVEAKRNPEKGHAAQATDCGSSIRLTRTRGGHEGYGDDNRGK